ncbi:site-specific integrase [Longibaculum muris]|uniref:Phage integrase family protein n=1 Tax=Longibaculum muris TaxID=1796628 RepID=A0A4R3Z8H2_9FIRM|nr:site-specific integrase [Longibaculum muris]KXU41359.1 site-specific recombinase, phage integrase family [Candidatus Stoquefichus sp. KLE1796]MCR1886892.1 site-specific integrase [Longibaculum muris]TCW02923.1 phage integrase family protein [Longibaculum muris]
MLDFIEGITQNISRKSLQDIVVVLKSILYYGKILRYSIFALNAIPSVIVTKKKIIILDWKDLNNLETFICHNMSYKNIGLFICLYTGIRLGEIYVLKCRDILLHDEKIIINESVQRINEKRKSYTEIDMPKIENLIRKILINQNLYQYLILFQKAHGYILTGTEHYLTPRIYQYYFKRILNYFHIKDYNFHILRHTFATRCVQCNVDIKSLSEILRRSSVNTTLDIYTLIIFS